MCRVTIFSNLGHGQGQVLKILVSSEGVVTKNTPAQYESPMSNGKKVADLKLKAYQMYVRCHGEGHLLKIDGTIAQVPGSVPL